MVYYLEIVFMNFPDFLNSFLPRRLGSKIPAMFGSVCILAKWDFYFLVLISLVRDLQTPKSVVRILDTMPICMIFFRNQQLRWSLSGLKLVGFLALLVVLGQS